MSLSSETGNLNRECAVAATMFEGAKTAHSLFKFPVTDDNESDLENPNVCNLKNTDRLELLKETSVIFWDEFPNHKEMFYSVKIALEDSPKIIFVCSGDFRQILPVIRNETAQDIMNATISSSIH